MDKGQQTTGFAHHFERVLAEADIWVLYNPRPEGRGNFNCFVFTTNFLLADIKLSPVADRTADIFKLQLPRPSGRGQRTTNDRL